MSRREKVFGPGRAVPLDRNAKARVDRLRPRLERPQPPAGPAQGADHPRLPEASDHTARVRISLPTKLR